MSLAGLRAAPTGAFVILATLAFACSPHAAGMPPGPPPEYEQPALPPWDGGAAAAPAGSALAPAPAPARSGTDAGQALPPE